MNNSTKRILLTCLGVLAAFALVGYFDLQDQLIMEKGVHYGTSKEGYSPH